jgi:octaprenyl-diphosphate synthase
LVGDFLFSQSFKLIVATGVQKAMTALSNASAIIAEGEVSQLAKLEQRVLISQEQYFAIIRAKTAELFGASCEVGAYISSKDELSKSLKEFGIVLGNIFQITDDLLDYFSKSDNVGKNVGDDFYEGKITLPVILLNDKLSKDNQRELTKVIQKDVRNSDELNWLISMLREHNIADEIKLYLNAMKDDAYQLIDSINGEYMAKLYLKNLVDFAVNRTY